MTQENQTEISDEKQKPWLFKKGQSGNPLGRPKGSFSFKSMIIQRLEESPELAEEICSYYIHDKRMRELLWKMIDGAPQGSGTEVNIGDNRTLIVGWQTPKKHKCSACGNEEEI